MEMPEYYKERERKNEELVKCAVWACVIILGLVVCCLAIKGCICSLQGC